VRRLTGSVATFRRYLMKLGRARRLNDVDMVTRLHIPVEDGAAAGKVVGQTTVSLHALRSALLAGRHAGPMRVLDAELSTLPRGKGGGPITQGRGWQDSGIVLLADAGNQTDL